MPTTSININTQFQGTGIGAAEVALGKVGATAKKAERDLLSYAQTVAKSQVASGDAAGAVRTYEAALAQVDRTSKQAIATERQLATAIATVQRQAASAPILPRTVESFGTQALTQLKTGLLGIVGPAAAATAALNAIPAAIELAKLGAQADLVRTRFDSLAESAGMTGDALLAALRKGSGREISDLNLQLAANKAQLLDVAHSADEFGVLMSIARDRAQQMGISTTQAFDDLVTGLGRGSRLILDNLGIIVNADEANKKYAQSIGKTVAALTDQERKQALINQVLKDGAATMAATGGAVESAAAAQARMGASVDNIKAKLGSMIANGTAPTVNSLSDLLNATDGTTDSMANAAIGAQNIIRAISGLPPVNTAAQQTQEGWTKAVWDWIAARQVQLGLIQAAPTTSGGGGTFEFADVALRQQVTQAQLAYADSLEMTSIKARAAQMAAEQKSAADKVAAIDAQTHGIAEEKLAQQAQAAAQALLNAGPAGARTAALLAQSSSQVDVLTAAYYRLAAAQGEADRAKTNAQALSDQRAGERDAGSARTAAQITFEADQDRKAQASRLRRAKEAEAELKKARSGSGGGKGLSTIDRQDIALAGDLNAQLSAVNSQLARGNLTQEQRNALLIKQRDLEEKITEEKIAQQRASIDASLKIVQDAQARLEEAREAARLNRALAGGKLTAEQTQAVQLRLQEMALEQQKRGLDIGGLSAKAGGVPTPIGAPTVGGAPTLAGVPAPVAAAPFNQAVAPPPVTVNIALTIADGRITQADAGQNSILNIMLNRAQAGNAGGARG